MDQRSPTPLPIVTICDGKLTARMVLPAGLDAEAASALSLWAVAKERGVELHSGLEALLSSLSERYAEDGQPLDVEIASATPATDGEDAWIEWADGCDPAELADDSDVDHDEAVDFYNRQSFISVGKGDQIATLHPATDGSDGRDVCGGTIAARPGKRLGMKIDGSLILGEHRRLFAGVDGVLKLAHGKLRIEPVLEIHGTVDFSTGNINFDGDVIVREDIRDHFRIQSTKDVVIDGLIDASQIICGGNLQARRGVAGRDEGTLDVGGDAEIGYIEKTRGTIGGTLRVAREIMHSALVVRGDVVSELGRVIGGSLHAFGDVRVAELGSRGDTPTLLILGPRVEMPEDGTPETPQPKVERLERMRHELQALRDGAATNNPVAAERMTELEFEIADIENSLQGEHTESDEDGPGAPPRAFEGTLEVLKAIHARVTIEANGRTILFGHELRGPVKIWLEGQTVMHQIGNGTPEPLRGVAGIQDRIAA